MVYNIMKNYASICVIFWGEFMKKIFGLLLLLSPLFLYAENWIVVERSPARSLVGPIHYKYVPARYEDEIENGETKQVFIAPEYITSIPIYNKEYEITQWHTDYSETIYRRLNKRPSIEVTYDVVTYIGQESNDFKIEFENVEILVN